MLFVLRSVPIKKELVQVTIAFLMMGIAVVLAFPELADSALKGAAGFSEGKAASELGPIMKLIDRVTNWVLAFATAVAVLLLAAGGLRAMGGDRDAFTFIKAVLKGYLIIVFAKVIIL